MEAAKPCTTSYGCTKAEKAENYEDEAALAICHKETWRTRMWIGRSSTRRILAGLNIESRKTEVEEQRSWVKKRNKECVIYQGWVYCLTEAHHTRLAG